MAAAGVDIGCAFDAFKFPPLTSDLAANNRNRWLSILVVVDNHDLANVASATLCSLFNLEHAALISQTLSSTAAVSSSSSSSARLNILVFKSSAVSMNVVAPSSPAATASFRVTPMERCRIPVFRAHQTDVFDDVLERVLLQKIPGLVVRSAAVDAGATFAVDVSKAASNGIVCVIVVRSAPPVYGGHHNLAFLTSTENIAYSWLRMTIKDTIDIMVDYTTTTDDGIGSRRGVNITGLNWFASNVVPLLQMPLAKLVIPAAAAGTHEDGMFALSLAMQVRTVLARRVLSAFVSSTMSAAAVTEPVIISSLRSLFPRTSDYLVELTPKVTTAQEEEAFFDPGQAYKGNFGLCCGWCRTVNQIPQNRIAGHSRFTPLSCIRCRSVLHIRRRFGDDDDDGYDDVTSSVNGGGNFTDDDDLPSSLPPGSLCVVVHAPPGTTTSRNGFLAPPPLFGFPPLLPPPVAPPAAAAEGKRKASAAASAAVTQFAAAIKTFETKRSSIAAAMDFPPCDPFPDLTEAQIARRTRLGELLKLKHVLI